MMSVPVMSEGIRSGVNWMRLNSRPSVCEMVRTISVFAVPGKPVIRQWPPTNSEIRIWSSTSSCPTMTWRTWRENVVAHRLKSFDALLQFRGIGIELSDGGHCLFPLVFISFVGILHLQEQFLGGAVIGRRFERCEDVVLGLVLLTRGEIGARQIELRGGLVERVHGDHGGVFANGAGKFFCANHKSPRWRCRSSSTG